MKQQIQSDGKADHLREVARGDGQLAQYPQEPHRRPRVVVAARLREVAARGDPQLDAQVLQQDRHQVGNHDDGQEAVAEFRPAREVGGPVARVHITHTDHVGRPEKGEPFAPSFAGPGHVDGAVYFAERSAVMVSILHIEPVCFGQRQHSG